MWESRFLQIMDLVARRTHSPSEPIGRLMAKDAYPIPFADELKHQFRDARVFSTCDALAGYWQVASSSGTAGESARRMNHEL